MEIDVRVIIVGSLDTMQSDLEKILLVYQRKHKFWILSVEEITQAKGDC